MAKRDLQKVGWCWLFDVVCASECFQYVKLLPLLHRVEVALKLQQIWWISCAWPLSFWEIFSVYSLYIIAFLHWTSNYDTFTVCKYIYIFIYVYIYILYHTYISYTFIYVHTLYKGITRASSWTSPLHGFVSQGLKRSNSWKTMPTLSLSRRFAMWMDTWLPGKAMPESYLWHLCSISSFETMGAKFICIFYRKNKSSKMSLRWLLVEAILSMEASSSHWPLMEKSQCRMDWNGESQSDQSMFWFHTFPSFTVRLSTASIMLLVAWTLWHWWHSRNQLKYFWWGPCKKLMDRNSLKKWSKKRYSHFDGCPRTAHELKDASGSLSSWAGTDIWAPVEVTISWIGQQRRGEWMVDDSWLRMTQVCCSWWRCFEGHRKIMHCTSRPYPLFLSQEKVKWCADLTTFTTFLVACQPESTRLSERNNHI